MLEMLSREPFFFDWRICLVQMAGFAVFFLVLKVLVFDRLLGFIRARRETLDTTERRIANARRDVEQLTASYEAKLAEADKAAYEEMQKVVREGIAAKGSILAAAQEDTRKVVEEARAAVAAEKEEAIRTVDEQVRALAADIAAAATHGATGPASS
jgi:F-type H+-transporting ATPase subunit b